MDFKILGYKCIISRKLKIDFQFIFENDIILHIFALEGNKYFVFSNNVQISDN